MHISVARTAALFALTTGLFVGAISSEGLSEHNPDQHIDFTCKNCAKDTVVKPHKTNIYITCYGKTAEETPFNVNCTSPAVDTNCTQFDQDQHSMCECTNTSKKTAHTVKLKIQFCTGS